MKKFLSFLPLILIFCQQHVNGQFSVKADGEYMFPFAGQQLDPNAGIDYFPSGTGSSVASTVGTYGTLGKGIAVGITADYTFKCHLTLEIGGRYWMGSKYSYADSIYGYEDTYNTTQQLKLFIISPSLLYKIGPFGKFTPYMGVGVDFALGAKMNEVDNGNYIFDSTVFNSTSTTTYLIRIGFNGQIGVSYAISNRIAIFAGFRFDAFSLMPGKTTLNSETDNGTPVDLSTFSTSEKEIVYYKSITAYTFNANQPDVELAQTTPASTFGINVGIEFKFGKKK